MTRAFLTPVRPLPLSSAVRRSGSTSTRRFLVTWPMTHGWKTPPAHSVCSWPWTFSCSVTLVYMVTVCPLTHEARAMTRRGLSPSTRTGVFVMLATKVSCVWVLQFCTHISNICICVVRRVHCSETWTLCAKLSAKFFHICHAYRNHRSYHFIPLWPRLGVVRSADSKSLLALFSHTLSSWSRLNFNWSWNISRWTSWYCLKVKNLYSMEITAVFVVIVL